MLSFRRRSKVLLSISFKSVNTAEKDMASCDLALVLGKVAHE